MASSGTFTSRRYGNSSVGPYLSLAWTQVSQSVANNTTTLDLTLRFHWSASIGYTFYSRRGSVQGNSYTYSGSVSGTSGSRVLRTQRVTISHNSNGARSVTLSGNITSLGLVYSGNRINTMSVSGTANLNTIPRASTLSAFSFNAHLKNGVKNQINYTVDRKSTGFRHHVQLRDGNTVVKTWDNQSSNGKSTLPLTASEVNTLLNRMKTSTTKSYTLRVRTRSGNNGGWIGGAVSRNATATVHADVKPSVGSVSLSQTGNPVTTHTLQGFSKIKANFTRSAGYGATITSSSIQVRRRSGGADSQTIKSNNGTTSKPVSLHGVYEARGTTRDSRGRTNRTAWATITVTRYNAPTITNFSAVRNGSTPTTVNLSRATTHTVLGTSNHLTYTIQRRQGTGSWTNVNSGATGTVTTSGATGSATSTGNSVTSSYEFRLVVTDKLGGRAESLQSVSTQRVVLDIHKNEGVGIGKIHENGVLDVDGRVYFRDMFYIDGHQQFAKQEQAYRATTSGWKRIARTSSDRGSLKLGVFTIGGAFEPRYTEISAYKSWGTGGDNAYHSNEVSSFWWIDQWRFTTEGGYVYFEVRVQVADFRFDAILLDAGNNTFELMPRGEMENGKGVISTQGSLTRTVWGAENSRGEYTRFSTGLQICRYGMSIRADRTSYNWELPIQFLEQNSRRPQSQAVTLSMHTGALYDGEGEWATRAGAVQLDSFQARMDNRDVAEFTWSASSSSSLNTSRYFDVSFLAVGRWKR